MIFPRVALAIVLAALVAGCDGTVSPTVASSGDPVARDVMRNLLDGTGIRVRSSDAQDETAVVVTSEAFAEMAGSPMDVAAFAGTGVSGLADRLAEAFPEHAERIRENEADYAGDLARLDAYGESALGRVPEDQRVVADERLAPLSSYGLTVSPDGRSVEGLLFEPADEGVEATYVGMMDHNFTMLARGLGAPGIDVHGMTGQLTLGHDHGAHAGGHEGHDHGDHAGHDHDDDHAGHDHGDHDH